MRASVDGARSHGFVAAEIRALMNLAATEQDALVGKAICDEATELAIRVGNRSLALWTSQSNRLNAYYRGDGWDEALAPALLLHLDLGGDRR